MLIEILGAGCPKCFELERRAKVALQEAGLEGDSEVVHLYDVVTIARRGVVLTPALLVDGVVKIKGRVPSVEEIREVLRASVAPPAGGV